MTNQTSPNPLAYTGLDVYTTPQAIPVNRAPAVTDWQSFMPGDFWRDISVTPPVTYLLESVANNQAVWRPVAQTSTNPIATINTISPDTSGNFTIAAGAGITITPGVNQISVASTSSFLAYPFKAFVNATYANVTGDGSLVSPLIFQAEEYDPYNAYDNTTGIWTCPATGIYHHTISLELDGASGSDFFQVTFTDGLTIDFEPVLINYTNVFSSAGGNKLRLTMSIEGSFTIGQQPFVRLFAAGGAKTISIFGGASNSGYTYWAAHRINSL